MKNKHKKKGFFLVPSDDDRKYRQTFVYAKGNTAVDLLYSLENRKFYLRYFLRKILLEKNCGQAKTRNLIFLGTENDDQNDNEEFFFLQILSRVRSKNFIEIDRNVFEKTCQKKKISWLDLVASNVMSFVWINLVKGYWYSWSYLSLFK